MASIPKQAIRKIVRQSFGLQISDDAAAAMARLLEKKAEKISKFAVKNARKEKRSKVTRRDIREYALREGLDED